LSYGTWIAVGAYYNHVSQRAGLYLNGNNVVDVAAPNTPVFTNLLISRGGSLSSLSKRVDTADPSLWGRVLSASEFSKLANPRYRPLNTGNRGFPLSRLV